MFVSAVMASVYLQPGNSKFWMARFKGPNGKWMSRSTKLTKRDEALRLAFLWEGSASDLVDGDAMGAQVSKVVRDIYEKATGKRPDTVSISKFLNDWSKRIKATKAEKTAERYSQVVRDFLAHLDQERAAANIATLRGTEIQSFLDNEIAKGKGGMTVTLTGKVLRTALNAALRAGMIERNPTVNVEFPDAISESRQPFTDGEVESILTECQGSDWETAILVGRYTGARLGDACNMRWQAVDLAGGSWTYVPEKTSRGKRRKELVVPLHSQLLNHLETLAGKEKAQRSEFICPELAEKPVGGRAGLSKTFEAIMRKAGVETIVGEKKEGKGRRFSAKTFHSLRHTFNSNLADAGVSQEVRRVLTGHASDAMNDRYTKFKPDTLREAVARLA